MRTLARLALTAGAAVLFGGCAGSQPPIGAPGAMAQNRIRNVVPQWQAQHLARATCPQVVGKPTCLALQVLKGGITPLCSPTSSCGWTPAQLETAYGLSGALGKGSGTNIALIEAGDLANASSDLSTYRKQYGLGSGNLTRYNESGQQSNYPPSCENYGWCIESDLDIDMVAAACPKCNIFLMEAKGGISDFEAAEAEAVTLGATILSNSWICYGSYDCSDTNFANYFDTPGIAYLAGSGDGGYADIGAPSALANVIAVGGTQLAVSGSKYSESIWDGAGGGCADPSAVGGPGIAKPSWQKDPDCSYRTIADVSSEAGCSPGVAVYSSVYGGWTGVCGTSAASPFTAGVVALAGNVTKLDAGKTFWTFSSKHHKKYFNHPSGEGSCGNYLCGDGRYKKYYSGPGGWGSPKGIRGY
ncbi:MAG: S8 family serine peptidase [Candidatus Cybelea sp.]